MAEELDAEEVSDALRSYHDQARTAVQSFGGRIAQLLGDGVLAYFGYPVAHEDDAERAVQAGLELIRKLREDVGRRRRPIAARIGMAAGPVVMREMEKLEGWNSESAVGLTINLAARIQGEADAHSVVVDSSVQRSLGAAFAMMARRQRVGAEGRWRAILGHGLDAVQMLKQLASQGAVHGGAFLGTTLYWVGDVGCLWACLRAFHDSPDIAALIIGYATGYALTRRTLPLGGAGSVEVLVSFALAWTGIPLAKAVLAVCAYRIFNLWLPLLPAAIGLRHLKRWRDLAAGAS